MLMRATLILSTAGLLLGGTADDSAKAELKTLQGTWKVVSLAMAGKPLPAEKVEGTKLIFKGDELTIGLSREKGNTMRVKLDPTKKPRAIDLLITRGDEKVTWKCIYALDGDTLRFVLPLAPTKGSKVVGEPYGVVKRPESFDAKDKPFMIFTAERQK